MTDTVAKDTISEKGTSFKDLEEILSKEGIADILKQGEKVFTRLNKQEQIYKFNNKEEFIAVGAFVLNKQKVFISTLMICFCLQPLCSGTLSPLMILSSNSTL